VLLKAAAVVLLVALLVLGSPAGPTGPDEEGIREESLAILMANFDDFSFGDSIHCRLCRTIVADEVVLQPQMHFLVFDVILGRARARGQEGEYGGFLRGHPPVWLTHLQYQHSLVLYKAPPLLPRSPHLDCPVHHATSANDQHLKAQQKGA